MLDDVLSELAEVAAEQRALKRYSLTYQRELKLEVAAHYRLTLAEVDLPYAQWAEIRDKYIAEVS
jgi:hypothetical protein